MNISVLFLCMVAFVKASNYMPPTGFCASINSYCKDHFYCNPQLELIASKWNTTSTTSNSIVSSATSQPIVSSTTTQRGFFGISTERMRPEHKEEDEVDFGHNHQIMDNFEKEKFVRMVNYIRNEVACGEPALVNYDNQILPKAAKMQEVEWNEELEWAAEALVKVGMKTTKHCLLTPNFKNIFLVKKRHSELFPYELYSKLSNFLVDTMSSIRYFSVKDGGIYGDYNEDLIQPSNEDFLMKHISGNADEARLLAKLLHDNVNKMGCAALAKYTPYYGRIGYDVFCVFSEKKMNGSAVYKTSKTAGSECERLHPELKCLCSNNEYLEKVTPTVTNTNTNRPIQQFPDGEEHWRHQRRPTCPTVIRIWRSTTRRPPVKIPFCKEVDTLRSGTHLPESFSITIVGFVSWHLSYFI